VKQITVNSVCEGCGVKDSKKNPLGTWMHYNFQDKIMCGNCTEAESKRVLNLIQEMIDDNKKKK
jgi:superfamily II helicase